MFIGEPFYELLVGICGETLFNFFSEGSKSVGGFIGVGKVGAGQGRDARRQTVKVQHQD